MIEKLNDMLMNEKTPLLFEKSLLILQEKSDRFQNLAVLVPEICDPMTFSVKVIATLCSADWSLLIDKMIAEFKMLSFKKVESGSQNDW